MAATAAYIWRTGSGNFVCSYTGSDYFGNGTQQKPYKTLTKAYYTNPSTGIVCRGIFTDNLTGAHNSYINADYYGAAVWDGQNVSNLYGFQHSNMVFINSNAATGGFVGVGCAAGAGSVGAAYYVYGLAGSPALLDNCGTYWGVLGGNSAVNNIVYSRMKANLDYKINLATYSGNTANFNNTVFGVPKLRMSRSIQGFINSYWLFSQTAIYIDQSGTFNRCMFSSDCSWWFSTGVTSGGIEGFSAIAAAGSGYAVGDIITVGGTGSGCTVPVKTIGVTGNVTALGHIINAGSGYNISNGKPTTTNRVGGTGLTLSVAAGGLNNQFIPYKSRGTLSADIAADTTTIPFSALTNTLPTVGNLIIDKEEISYTGNTGTSLTGCTRGVNGTSAVAHITGAILESGEMASIVEKRRILGTGVTFTECKYTNQPATIIKNKRINLYDSAVNWEYVTFGTGCTFWSAIDTQFTITGSTDIEKMASIAAAATCTFLSCRYDTSGESIQLFNNAQKQDYTLNPLSDAVLKVIDATFPTIRYYGALKPALNIPIMSNSDGVPGTWDEKTIDAGGLIYISNDEIHFHETGVASALGTITSKVIELDTATKILDGLKSMFFPVFNTSVETEGASFSAAIDLPIGKYIVAGTTGAQITYKRLAADATDQTLTVGDKFYVVRANCQFTNVGGNTSTVKILSNSTQKFYMDDRQLIALKSNKKLAGTAIPIGSYIVCGNRILYNSSAMVAVGEILVATTAGLTFTDLDGQTAYLLDITETATNVNIWNPVLVRIKQAVMSAVSKDTSLTAGDVLLNTGDVNVVYQGVTIVPKESFTVKVTGHTFTCASATYSVSKIFIEEPTIKEWMPATAFDDFWNMTAGGVQQYTDAGTRPASSGNPSAWALTGNVKNAITKKYVQFKIMLRQYDTV